MKIIEYCIAQGEDSGTLEDEVFESMKEGWEPIGGVSANTDELNQEWFYQAMVKYE